MNNYIDENLYRVEQKHTHESMGNVFITKDHTHHFVKGHTTADKSHSHSFEVSTLV